MGEIGEGIGNWTLFDESFNGTEVGNNTIDDEAFNGAESGNYTIDDDDYESASSLVPTEDGGDSAVGDCEDTYSQFLQCLVFNCIEQEGCVDDEVGNGKS